MKKYILISLITILISNISISQWNQSSNGMGNNQTITSICSYGNTIIAGTFGNGIFISTNSGNSWLASNNGLTNLFINSIVEKDSYFFLGTKAGVFISTNSGNNWSPINNGLIRLNVLSLCVYGDYIYAGLDSSALYRSSNNGDSWNPYIFTNTFNIKNIRINNNHIYVQNIDDGGIAQDTIIDGNYTFRRILTKPIYSFDLTGTNIYVGTNGQGIWINRVLSSSWFQSSLPSNMSFPSVSAYYSNIYAGSTTNGVYFSSDNGINWNNINSGFNSLTPVRSLGIGGNYIFAGLEGQSIWKKQLSFNFSQQNVDFGLTQVNTQKEKLINVNFLYDTVNIISVKCSDTSFKVLSDTSFILYPSDYKDINISYTPKDTNTHNSSLIIKYICNSNIFYDSSVFLTGKGKSITSTLFSLFSPSNFSVDVAVYRSFQWLDAFNGQPGTYRLRYGTDPNFSTGTYTEVNNISGTEWYPEEDLALNNIYYWMVYAKNSDGTYRPANEVFQFQTIINTPLVFNKTFGNRKLRQSNSPYTMNGDYIIDTNNTFTIPAGTEIKVNDNFEFIVKGSIKSLGTALDSVKFYSNTNSLVSGKWKGIRFFNTAKDLVLDSLENLIYGSEFRYTVIKNTGYGNSPSINSYIDNSICNIKISYCSFYLNNCSVFVVKVPSSKSIIQGSSFFSDSAGIYGGRIIRNCNIYNIKSNGVISDCISFVNNSVSNNIGWGVNLPNCTSFKNNSIFNNSNFGAYLPKCIEFKRNSIVNNLGYGANVGTGSVLDISIDSNIIKNNNGQNSSDKYGIKTNSNARFSFNSVSYNAGFGGIWGGKSYYYDSVFNNTGYGIYTETNSQNSSISNLKILNNGMTGLMYVGTPSSNNLAISNSNFVNNTGSGIFSRNITNLTIENNNIINNFVSGIILKKINNLIFTYNNINNNKDNGIYCDTIINAQLNNNSLFGYPQNMGVYPPDGLNSTGIVLLNSRDINLKYSTIKNFWAFGINSTNSRNLKLIKDSILSNLWAGMKINTGDTLRVDSCKILFNGNTTDPINGGGIYLNINNASLNSNIINFNKANYGSGIFINEYSPYLFNNSIYGNRAKFEGGGLYIGGTSSTKPYLIFNTITNDSSENNRGGGIFIKNLGNKVSLIGNIISDNFGIGIFGDPDTLRQNNILYNKFYNGTTGYALRKTNGIDLNGIQNWWGTRSDQVYVENSIFHKPDSAALGLVTFQPFLTSPSSQAPGQIIKVNKVEVFSDSTYNAQFANYLPFGKKFYVQLTAIDENAYSKDITPVRVKNLRNNQIIELLTLESNISTGIFRDTGKTATATNFLLNQIGTLNGDTLLFYSTIVDTVNKKLVVSSLSIPSLVAPINGTLGCLTNISLIWNKVSDATNYMLQLSTDSNFINVVFSDSTLIDSLKTINGLSINTNYYWRVSAKNINSFSGYSGFWKFKTLNSASLITLIYPQNSSINIPVNLIFKWTKGSDLIFEQKDNSKIDQIENTNKKNKKKNNDINNYTDNERKSISKYWFESTTDTSIFSNFIRDTLVVDTLKSVTNLNYITNYYWRVKGKNELGWGSFTQWNIFSTVTLPIPVSPNLITPVNNSTGNPLNLSLVWNKPQYATGYNVVLATDAGFTNIILNDSLLTDSIKVLTNMTPLTNYFWKVRAKNVSGWGVFSSAYTFKTVGVPTQIVLSTPANNATNQPVNLTFKWFKAQDQVFDEVLGHLGKQQNNIETDEVITISNYWFELALDSLFTSFVARDSLLTDTTKSITGLNNNIKYYWRVKAKNQIGWAAFSDKWNFTTIVPIPIAPILNLPANNSTGISLTPLLDWSDVQYSASYRIQISTDLLFNTVLWDTSGVVQSQVNIPANKLTGMTQYYWRVNSTNIAGTGNWSPVWNFRTLQNLTLNLKVYLEGFWNGTTQVSDTTTIYLANSLTPFTFIDSAKVILSTSGSSAVNFTKAPNANYYIVINHRNHLETWSKLAQSFVTNVAVNYDFTTAANKAYGDNMKQVGSVWVLYGGDANRDGSIDALDVIYILNQFGSQGYLQADFNGDQDVTGQDVALFVPNFGATKIVPTLMVNPVIKTKDYDLSKMFEINKDAKETVKTQDKNAKNKEVIKKNN